MLSASTDAGASLNVQGPETISQQTGSGLYSQYYKYLTVTVQFETERSGQNKIFSHMDRSEVKPSNSEKNIVIPHTHNEILKQKNFTGSEFEGVPKLLKAFFSKLFL